MKDNLTFKQLGEMFLINQKHLSKGACKMNSIEEPIAKIRMPSAALLELLDCEYGSYEDHIRDVQCDRCMGSGERCMRTCGLCKGKGTVVERLEPYDKGALHLVEIVERSKHKTVVYLHTQEEVDEFFVQACTGTFGMRRKGICLRIHDLLELLASEQARKLVNRGNIGY